MTREECERKIAEYCVAIRLTMQEYDPDFDYLHLSIYKSIDGNGNDNGEWDCYSISGNNSYWKENKEHPINFHAFKDIKDDKYWKCVSEEIDRECDEVSAYEGSMLSDGTHFYSERVDI